MHIFHKWPVVWGKMQQSDWTDGFGNTGKGMFQTKTCKTCGMVRCRQV